MTNAVLDFMRGVAAFGFDNGDDYPLQRDDARALLRIARDNMAVGGEVDDPKTARLKKEYLPDHVTCPGCGEEVTATPYLEDYDVVPCQKCGTRVRVEIVCYAVGYKDER